MTASFSTFDGLEFLATGKGVGEYFFVRVFEHASGSDATSETSDLNGEFAQLVRNIERSAIPFHCWVGGHDNLNKIASPHAFDERINAQMIWANTIHRRNASVLFLRHERERMLQ